MPPEFLLLRKLSQEVGEIKGAHQSDARILLRDFAASCSHYCRAVAPQVYGSKMPEQDVYGEDRNSWLQELKAADEFRRSAHNALLASYYALTRFCRLHRKKDLSVEERFATNAPRNVIGDLAGLVHNGLVQASDLDETLHQQLT
jgi:hypothetical protein